ncbi:unnamed protein product [Blepharisma stoltei]|uniref:Uncharacterized protein n=1 Tax=Blepharisma stoltei TaxID=1481888 RepID=A0AAU9JWF7_9CILI|nr:unnamed protein product [Blepharisma stoltei]
MDPVLLIKASTWLRETHGLFDYESKTVVKSNLKISTSTSLYRSIQSCYIWSMAGSDEFPEGSEALIDVKKTNGSFQISLLANSPYEKMWQVIKFVKNQGIKGHPLKKGDWIKLGRIRLHIKQIQLANSEEAKLSLIPNSEDPETNEMQEEKNEESMPCRICLSEITSPLDPLIAPCKCAGTMKYVHINCLKEWLKNRITARETPKAISYYWKDFSCELCKTKLPSIIQIGGQQYELIGFTHPTKPFIILEDFRSDLRHSNGVHIITLEPENYAEIGRGHECDVKLTDISVSRNHSKIKLINDQFYLEDQNSKFGTLLRMKGILNININQSIVVQVNRTVLQLEAKQPANCFSCFNRRKKSKITPRPSEVAHLTRDDNADESCVERLKRYPNPMLFIKNGHLGVDEAINSSNVIENSSNNLVQYEEQKNEGVFMCIIHNNLE